MTQRRSQRLRFDDTREVFRLVGELCELGADPATWRRHMLVRMNRLVGARISYVLQSRPPFENGLATITSLVDEGFEEGGLELLFDYMFEGGLQRDPCVPQLAALFVKGRHFTVTRREMVPDNAAWYSSHQANHYYKLLGVDDFMSTQYFLGAPYTTQAINFHRDLSDKTPFSPREQKLTHFFHTELGRLWEKKDLPKPDPCEGLSPRMRQIVSFIRAGYVEKEMASKTKLSPHTIHDYIKRLHTHFGVSNRAGLLVATTPPPVPYRPALAP